MRELKTEQQELQTRYRLHLVRLSNDFRDKELALLMGMGVEQADLVRKMRAGNATIQTCRMIHLSQMLVQEYGDVSLVQEMVPEGYTALAIKAGETNGTISDELVNIMKLMGDLANSATIENPDKLRVQNLVNELTKEFATLQEEIKKL